MPATSPWSPTRSPPPTAEPEGAMMIENLQAHYGFTIMPFGSAVPAAALFGSAAHQEAVARLRWLISARGLGGITGELGARKTLPPPAAADGLDPSRPTPLHLPNPHTAVPPLHPP